MTGNKRFICKEIPRINHPSMYRVIEDTLTGNEYYDSLKDIDDIVDLLNKLNEGNEDLKQENRALKTKLHKVQLISKGY